MRPEPLLNNMNQLAKDVMWAIEIWMDSGDVGAGDLGIDFNQLTDIVMMIQYLLISRG